MRERLVLIIICMALGFASSAEAQLTDTFGCLDRGGTECRSVIPDAHGGAPGVLVSTLPVPPGTCSDPAIGRTVLLRTIWHGSGGEAWFGDLGVVLRGPGGAMATVPVGGLAAPPSFEEITEYRSFGALVLDAFNGETAAGAWTLEITDSVNTDYGALDDWSLTFICGPVPVVTIEATDPVASEEPYTTGMFTITRSVVWSVPLDVSVLVMGDAAYGSDYRDWWGPPPGSFPLIVTIPSGEASTTLLVDPIMDDLEEGDEVVHLQLDYGLYYDLGSTTQADVIIQEEYLPPGFSTSTKRVTDASGNGIVQAGEVLTYTITVANSGEMPAVDVIIEDTAPAGTRFIVGSVAITADSSGGTPVIVTGNDPGDTSLRVDVDTLAGGGGSITIVFDVVANDPLPYEPIRNIATITEGENPPFEIIGDVLAGTSGVPALDAKGILAMVLLMGAAGMLFLRRRIS